MVGKTSGLNISSISLRLWQRNNNNKPRARCLPGIQRGSFSNVATVSFSAPPPVKPTRHLKFLQKAIPFCQRRSVRPAPYGTVDTKASRRSTENTLLVPNDYDQHDARPEPEDFTQPFLRCSCRCPRVCTPVTATSCPTHTASADTWVRKVLFSWRIYVTIAGGEGGEKRGGEDEEDEDDDDDDDDDEGKKGSFIQNSYQLPSTQPIYVI